MSRPYSRRSLRLIAVLVCFSFVISTLTVRSQGAQASAFRPQQGNQSTGNVRKVEPLAPRKGAPAMALPNLDELKRQPPHQPQAPPPVASSVRSKRKRLPAGNGQSFTPQTFTRNVSDNRRAHHRRMIAASPPQSGSSYADRAMARLDPFNQTGNQLLARDCEWSLPLLSLPGRAGLDLGLTLSYSSLVWTRSGNSIYFDEDNGTPSPGFRLGFPTIGDVFVDPQVNVNARLQGSSK